MSFIVPVRNDAARLGQCLATIAEACYGVDHEVLVIDNGSTDQSPHVAARMGAVVLSRPDACVARLRNEGARAAAGAIVAFVDADHEIDPGWAEAALELLSDATVAAAGSLCHAPPRGTWIQRTYDALRSRAPGRRDVDWLGSGNLAIRRELFDEVGGFDETLDTCEDVDLCQRLRARGHRVVSDERMKSVHHGDPATLGELFRGERWRGRDNVRVSVRAARSARTVVSAAIPLIDVVSVGAAAAVLVIRPQLWPVAIAACGIVLGFSILRAGRMILNAPPGSRPRAVQAVIVALVYDLARASALVTPASHVQRRHRGADHGR